MKHPKPLLLCLAWIMILSQACTPASPLSKSGVTPTQTRAPSTATPLPATATPEPTAEESLPTSLPSAQPQSTTLVDLYQANVDARVWSEGEGLAALLGLMTGENPIGQVPGGDRLKDTELTGLLRLSMQFLKDNPTGGLHDRIQLEVNKLIAPLDRLDELSKPGRPLIAATGGGITFFPLNQGSAVVRPAGYRPSRPNTARTVSGMPQSQMDCQALWADGFTTAATPLVCFEYAEAVMSATRIRLYYPSYWPTGDPRLHQLSVMIQAAKKAVETYTPYGPQPMPNVSMVVAELPDRDEAGHILLSTDAAAVQPAGRPNDCYVAAFPALFSHDDRYTEQVIAHELFHCYEYRNLSNQINGPVFHSTLWWVEGGAEFFGNVVYPANDAEYIFLPDLGESLPRRVLTQFQYEAFIFWQYLENRPEMGIPGILRLMRSLPTRGGAREQIAGLAAFPNIDVIFHEFVEALVDGRIRDSNGAYIPYRPEPILERYLGAPDASAAFHAVPFLVGFARIHLAGGKDYTLQTTTTGSPPGLYHTERPDAPGSWAAAPDMVFVPCGQSVLNIVVTQARPMSGSNYDVRLAATWQPSAEACDQCLLGAWQLDNGSYLNFLNNLIAQKAGGAVIYTDISGEDLVRFTPDLHITQGISGLRIIAKMAVPGGSSSDGTHLLETQIDGESSTTYTAAGGLMSFAENQADLTIATMMDGQAVSVPVDTGPLSSGPLGTGGAYTCTGDTLQITPSFTGYENLPALRLTRVR